jgi:catechol 2,3-dioxygenase-like lactoylglutathione lyase family enzyme
MTDAAPPPITGIHHAAYRCRDAEETRRFYEDVMGLKLAAALDFDEISGTDEKLDYMHLFFELGDGNYLAFFDLPDSADEKKFRRKSGFNLHFAFEVGSMEEVEAFKKRFDDLGIENHGPLDHEFVKSIYAWDPNGYQIEVTCRVPKHDEIMAHEMEKARKVMEDWTARTMPVKAGKVTIAKAG